MWSPSARMHETWWAPTLGSARCFCLEWRAVVRRADSRVLNTSACYLNWFGLEFVIKLLTSYLRNWLHRILYKQHIDNNHIHLPPLPTLNLYRMMSPSSTTYSFPCCRYLPSAFTAFSLPCSTKSVYFITSAQMNPFSKSVWITPAAWGALVCLLMVQHLTSSSPAVKK